MMDYYPSRGATVWDVGNNTRLNQNPSEWARRTKWIRDIILHACVRSLINGKLDSVREPFFFFLTNWIAVQHVYKINVKCNMDQLNS